MGKMIELTAADGHKLAAARLARGVGPVGGELVAVGGGEFDHLAHWQVSSKN